MACLVNSLVSIWRADSKESYPMEDRFQCSCKPGTKNTANSAFTTVPQLLNCGALCAVCTLRGRRLCSIDDPLATNSALPRRCICHTVWSGPEARLAALGTVDVNQRKESPSLVEPSKTWPSSDTHHLISFSIRKASDPMRDGRSIRRNNECSSCYTAMRKGYHFLCSVLAECQECQVGH
jgi:hypothetical protein